MKIFALCLAFILCLAMPAAAMDNAPAAEVPATARTEKLTITSADGKNHVFDVEVVSKREDMAKGLMFRTSMPEDHGMLFVFTEEDARSFWMKNTFIPLDIIFIGKDAKIRNIGYGKPQSLEGVPSDGVILHALELNAGTAKKLGIKAGDTVHHAAFGNALE